MKTNGLVFRCTCPAAPVCDALPRCRRGRTTHHHASAGHGDDLDSPEVTISDSSLDTVAFHDYIAPAARNPLFLRQCRSIVPACERRHRRTHHVVVSTTAARPAQEISFATGTGVDDNYGVGSRFVVGASSAKSGGWLLVISISITTTTGFPRLTPGTTPLPTFGTYVETDTLQMYSIDLEAVRSFHPGKTKIDATFGARQASIDVQSLLDTFGVITTGNFVNVDLSNGCAFDGAGITSALMVRRQIGDSPVYVFAGGRGSKMWGHSDSFGRSEGAVASSPSAPLVGAATVTRNNADSNLVILEAQLGLQVEFAFRDFPATAFFRVAFEYQDWDINGPPTGGAGFGGTIGTLTTNSFASAGLGDTELEGAAVATASLGRPTIYRKTLTAGGRVPSRPPVFSFQNLLIRV